MKYDAICTSIGRISGIATHGYLVDKQAGSATNARCNGNEMHAAIAVSIRIV